MSSTYDRNDFETSESFETPRILHHDDFEDNGFVARPVMDSESPAYILHAGLGGVHHMPVSLMFDSWSLLAG